MSGIVGDPNAIPSTPLVEYLEFYPLPDGTFGVMAGKTRFLDKVTIPSTYNGIAVTQILPEGFKNMVNLETIIIPNSITVIGDNAFYGCTNLTNASLPSSITSIGQYAFYDCSSLTEITIPSGVNFIGMYAYYKSGITNAVFENASGWNIEYYYRKNYSISGEKVYVKFDLSDSSLAAQLLTEDVETLEYKQYSGGSNYNYSYQTNSKYKIDWERTD